jgi:hypothetical protein
MMVTQEYCNKHKGCVLQRLTELLIVNDLSLGVLLNSGKKSGI